MYNVYAWRNLKYPKRQKTSKYMYYVLFGIAWKQKFICTKTLILSHVNLLVFQNLKSLKLYFFLVGSYENPRKTGYKHMYFNATFEMLIIWILTLVTIILAYESFKRLLNLYSTGNLRWRMLILFLLDIYPNYYSYWSYFNYTNDGFYAQVYHQLFFTTTELVSTWNVFRLCSKDTKMESGSVMCIVAISIIHILLGGVDQFFVQLILWKEKTFQRARNIGFVLPDILHVILTIQEMAKENRISWTQTFTRNELKFGLIFVISGFVLGKVIFR